MSEKDILTDLFSQLEMEEPADVDDLTTLSLPELQDLLSKYDDELKALGEVLAGPVGGTPQARDVHSRRGAVVVAMRKRGW